MIEYKEMYTFEELCKGLEISMSQFSKKANIDEGTILRIRQGKPARLSTTNKILRAFSEIYGIKLSLDNVSGLILQTTATRKPAGPPVETSMPIDIPALEISQNRPVERKIKIRSEIPNDLPTGTIRLIDFIEKQGLPESSISYYVSKGFKGEKIETTQRARPSGSGMQHFLTPEQQKKALDFLKRHGKMKEPVAEEPAWYAPDGK